MHRTKYIAVLFSIIAVLFVYRNILISPVNLGNDFNFVSYDHFNTYTAHPYIWDSTLNNGLGGYVLFTLLFQPYSSLSRWWMSIVPHAFILHKLIFLFPVLILGLCSTIYAARSLLNNSTARTIFLLLYLINPYILMLVSGGQIGVALAYMFLPTFFAAWYSFTRKIYFKIKPTYLRILLTSLTVPAMLMLDARVLLLAIILLVPIIMYIILTTIKQKNYFTFYLFPFSLFLITSPFLTLLIHAHWILPAILVEKVALPAGYASSTAADFFSFTRFAHPLTWTHPNYPDNIFGKVNEVSGLSFIFPILAFLAIKLRPTKLVIYLSATALMSAFLAKGTSEPFGGIYLWLFQNVPGMSLFRDSTKFFIPLSLCYTYLISITIEKLQTTNYKQQINHKLKILNSKYVKPFLIYNLYIVISAIIIAVWFPTFTNQVKGTLQYRTYPESFQQLENTLKADQSFGRVLWIPTREIYGYTSLNHPAVNLEDLLRAPSCLKIFCQQFPIYPDNHIFSRSDLSHEIAQRMSIFNHAETENYFQKLAINYVTLSPDYDQKIYTLDYKPDPSIYEEYKSYLDTSFILRPVSNTNNLAVYKVHNAGVFMSNLTTGEEIAYIQINPTHYKVNWSGGQGYLLVSQSHDQRWQIRDANNNVLAISQATSEGLSSFDMNFPAGDYHLVFSGQEYADLGWIISRATTVFAIITLLTGYFINRKSHAKK